MTDKKEIYKKFQEKQERDTIKNKGITLHLGDTTINIKELLWDNAELLEDKVIEISGLFKDLDKIKFSEIKPEQLLTTVVENVMRKGLLDLSNILTNGEVTIEFIREHQLTKNEVIILVTEGLILNYGFVKNLLSLFRK